MKKVLFIATVLKTHINVFHLPYLKMFKEKGYGVYVAAKNDCGEETPTIPNCDCFYNIPFERNPFSVQNIKAYKKLKKIIDREQFDIIECNTPVGGVIGRLASRKARKKGTRVIYIAHGFHFFKGSSPLSWLVYYPVEKILSRVTDVLVTINHEDYEIATSKFHASEIFRANGIGCDFKKFENLDSGREKMRKSLGIKSDDVMLISVGELIKRKNHETILNAVAKLKNSTLHYVIVGDGVLKDELREKAVQLGIDKNVHFAGFRTDIPQLLKSADIFCFPSYQEGLPVALTEAMAAALPVVASKIRGNTDLVTENKGGLMYAPEDLEGFGEGIDRLIKNPDLRMSMGAYNKAHIKKYDLEEVKKSLKPIFFGEE